MTIQELNTYIQHPEYLNKDTLSDMQRLAETYPYCATFVILYAKNLHNVGDLQFQHYLKKAALCTYHREELEKLMLLPAASAPASPTTAPVTAPSITTKVATSVYELPAWEEADSKPLKQQDLIDRFIAKNPKIQLNDNKFEYEEPLAAQDEPLSDSVFTESLAKIYIKQGQYVKALHIFERLNLKYPEKSTYFADQIRFLTKIIQTKS